MLVEKNLKEALEYYIKGKPVTALWIGEDGSMKGMPLSDILNQPENHFLVDVPAAVNPDFEQAVQEMTGTDQVDPEEIKKQVKYAVEHINVNDVVRYELTSYEGRSALKNAISSEVRNMVKINVDVTAFDARKQNDEGDEK